MRKKNKILSIVTNSIGEIDVLYPLYARLNKIGSYSFTVIFMTDDLGEKYKESEFYKFCEDALGISVLFWDIHPITKQNRNAFDKIINRVFRYVCYLKMIPLLLTRNIYIHEYTNNVTMTRLMHFFANRLGREVFAIPHGLYLQINSVVLSRVEAIDNVKMLIFDTETRRTHQDFGYKIQKNIGYVKMYKEWKILLYQYSRMKDIELKQKAAIILSRPVHEHYMDRKIYIFLFISSIKAIRKIYGNIKIYIKLHPRETADEIRQIIGYSNLVDIEFTREYTAILCLKSAFAIGFWTSAVIDAYAANIPVVEYYVEAKRFRELEPNGSVYKMIGFPSCDNQLELESILQKFKSKPKNEIYNNFSNRIDSNFIQDNNLNKIFSPKLKSSL